MNCACCRVKLFDSDTEELFAGSDIAFCFACKKKVTPFLEEENTYPTHTAHLKARRRELSAEGVTPAGISALAAYCAYLDRTGGDVNRRMQVSEPASYVSPAPVELRDETLELTEQIEALTLRVRVALLLACAGTMIGLGGLLTAVIALLF